MAGECSKYCFFRKVLLQILSSLYSTAKVDGISPPSVHMYQRKSAQNSEHAADLKIHTMHFLLW